MSGAQTDPIEQTFHAVWLRLVAPVGDENAIRELVDCAIRSGTVLDISASPALFGGHLRALAAGGKEHSVVDAKHDARSDVVLMAVGPHDLARAVDDEQAHSLVLAHLVETLSAIGREFVDFYFLKIDASLREDQISGALMALQEARSQGNLRYIGVAAKEGRAALSLMHLHDVFEVVVVYEGDAMSRPLKLLAESRGMTVVCASSSEIAPPHGSLLRRSPTSPAVQGRSLEAALIEVRGSTEVLALQQLENHALQGHGTLQAAK